MKVGTKQRNAYNRRKRGVQACQAVEQPKRRMKRRARSVMRIWAVNRQNPVSPRAVGVIASTHCRPCSCYLCQPGREVPPMRERACHDPESV